MFPTPGGNIYPGTSSSNVQLAFEAPGPESCVITCKRNGLKVSPFKCRRHRCDEWVETLWASGATFQIYPT